MAELDELVASTAEVIGGQIRKPKMADKHLRRPPFRFIHDTLMALNANTGMLDALLSEEERDSGNIKAREAKVAFLDKIIAFGSVVAGQPLATKSSKVVAGADPERTNELLLAIGRANLDDTIDFKAAAEAALRGEQIAVPRKGGAATAAAAATEPESKAPEPEAPESRERPKAKAKARAPAEESKAPEPSEEAKAPEPEEAKAPESSPSSQLSYDACDGQVTTTIAMLGPLVKKPKLSEKLLSKPPFRFLHDVMTSLDKSHGLFPDLWEGDETDARCGKEAKLSYLGKLTAYVAAYTGTCPAKATRIVAGHEPENTNKMLQMLAVIAENADAAAKAAAVRAVIGGGAPGESGSKERDTAGADDEPEAKKDEAPSERRRKPRHEESDVGGDAEGEEKRGSNEQSAPADEAERERRPARQQEDEDEDQDQDQDDNEHKQKDVERRTVRPRTARKRPPKLKEKTAAAPETGGGDRPVAPVGVMMDGASESESESDAGPEEGGQPQDDPAQERGEQRGELKGKLVRDIMEEDEGKEAKEGDKGAASGEPGITMGKIGRGVRRKSGTTGAIEVDKIREAVQTLCQSTNPLGKCMDFVHEDLNAMGKELERWRKEYQQSCDQLEEERKATDETLLPLKSRLLEVQERINDEHTRVESLKASIAKNDQRIEELLRDMVLHK